MTMKSQEVHLRVKSMTFLRSKSQSCSKVFWANLMTLKVSTKNENLKEAHVKYSTVIVYQISKRNFQKG